MQDTQKKKGFVRRSLFGFFQFRSWLGVGFLAKNAEYIADRAKLLLKVQKPTESKDTFQEALKRHGILERQLEQRTKEFQRLYLFFLVISFLLFVYSIYAAINGFVFIALAALGFMAFSLSLAFKYHFWLFQIKQRKLGCTLKEWFYLGLLRRHQ